MIFICDSCFDENEIKSSGKKETKAGKLTSTRHSQRKQPESAVSPVGKEPAVYSGRGLWYSESIYD